MSCEQWEARLDAYLDGHCDAQELAAIDAHLLQCPSCASEALGRSQIKQATRAAATRYSPSPDFAGKIRESIAPQSSSALPIALAGKRREWPWRIWVPGLAGAALATVLLVVTALFWTRHSAEQHVFAELLDTHVATLSSANPVDVISTDRHTVKPWFQGKLPFTFNLPEFQSSPFRLLGGRVAYVQQTVCAQLLLQEGNHKISVFIAQETSSTSTGDASISKRGFSIESFAAGGLRYTLISDSGPANLKELARLLRSVANATP